MSLSLITTRSLAAAASMRSRLNTLALGYGDSPVINSRAGIREYSLRILHNLHRWVGFVLARQTEFRRRIVLLEKCSQIRFEAEVQPGQWLQDADRFGRIQDRRLYREIAQSGDDRQQRIDDSTGQKGQQDQVTPFPSGGESTEQAGSWEIFPARA